MYQTPHVGPLVQTESLLRRTTARKMRRKRRCPWLLTATAVVLTIFVPSLVDAEDNFSLWTITLPPQGTNVTSRPAITPVAQPTHKPAPTLYPVRLPPTKRPTRFPAHRPTRRPTRNPVLHRPTRIATLQPTPKPKAPVRLPTLAPIPPTALPTNTPIVLTSSLQPTNKPIWKSPIRSLAPSIKPTPSTATVSTRAPTGQTAATNQPPSIIIQQSPSTTPSMISPIVPTIIVHQQSIVPIGFTASVISDENPNVLAADAKRIWESYILARLRAAYQNHSSILPRQVVLTVTARVLQQQQQQQQQTGTRRRWLQTAAKNVTQVLLRSNGQTFMDLAQGVNVDGSVTGTQTIMSTIVTKDGLQQALYLGNNNSTVVTVDNYETQQPARQNARHKPSRAEIVIACLLLVLVLASLVFYAHLFWTRLKKRLRKKRLAEIRAKQSYIVQSSASMPIVLKTFNTARSDSSTSSPYRGLGSGSDDRLSDEFARELEQAASLDEVVWGERQRQAYKLEPTYEGTSERLGKQNEHLGLYDARRSPDEEGMEVCYGLEGLGSFPYGDDEEVESSRVVVRREGEAVSAKNNNMELTLNNAVEWTAQGVSLKIVSNNSTEDDGFFEPYGDNRGKAAPSRTLPQSWDAEDSPAVKMEKPFQYSFQYPLRRRDLSDSSGSRSHNDRPFECSPTDAYTFGRQRTPVFVPNDAAAGEIKSQMSDSSSESSIEDPDKLLEEVRRLSAYVKRYGEKKDLQKSANKLSERNQLNGSSSSNVYSSAWSNRPAADWAHPTITNSSGSQNDSDVSSRNSPPRKEVRTTASASLANKYKQEPQVLAQKSNEFIRESEYREAPAGLRYRAGDHEDEESSQRLGISRFSVEKAPTMSLSYRVNTVLSESSAQSRQPVLLSPSRVNSRRANQAYEPDGRAAGADVNKRPQGGRSPVKMAGENQVERQVSPRTRSTNKDFNHIVNMFESKPKNSIIPPNESWQFNSGN
jgi:hypothetical protein